MKNVGQGSVLIHNTCIFLGLRHQTVDAMFDQARELSRIAPAIPQTTRYRQSCHRCLPTSCWQAWKEHPWWS